MPRSKVPQGSDIEVAFLTFWRIIASPLGYPDPSGQYPFFNYVLDYAFPDLKIAIELDGGRGGGYGHPVKCHACGALVRAIKKGGEIGKPLRLPYPSHSGAGAERDVIKQNLLVIGGWYPLRFSSVMLEDDPDACINLVIRLYKRLSGAEKNQVTAKNFEYPSRMIG